MAEVAVHQRGLLFQLLLGNGCQEFVADGVEAVLTLVLGLCGLCQCQALVVACLVHGLLQSLVLGVVRIVALDVECAELLHELLLHAAVLLYLFVGELDGLEHVVLADLVHLTLYHHNVLFSGGNHQVEVAVRHIAEGGVDLEFPVDSAHANL